MASRAVLAPPASTPPTHGDRPSLLPRLDETRRTVVRTRGWIAICLLMVGILTALSMMATLDYLFVVPFVMRAIWLVTISIGAIFGFVIGWRMWILPLSAHRVAAEIERHRPAIGQRLRTVADYEDPSADPSPARQELIAALRQQTDKEATNDDFDQLPAKEPLTRSVALLAVVLTVIFVALLAGRELRLAAGRAVLMPWHYTVVTVTPLDSTIKSNKKGMRPALQVEYERNLAVVDRAIAATRSAAKSNPNDPDAADFMFEAYQSKVDLLNTIADARFGGPRN